MPSEFALIRRHFTRPARHTLLAVGDDAALLVPRPGMQLAVSTDMLVAGTHFFPDTDAEALGWKTLAVNISDLAAMAAEPRWAFVALALPGADEGWIAACARGLFACAERFGVDIAGGDTTRGPLNLCVTIVGEVPASQAVTRRGARAGDDLWITGFPGRAALGLAHLRGEVTLPAGPLAGLLDALHRPQPRVEAGLALRSVATAMLDVSDGLVGDLAHILAASGVGAIVEIEALPLVALLASGIEPALAQRCVLAGGDDYELLFTAPPAQREAIAAIAAGLALPFSRIGSITANAGKLLLRDADGREHPPAERGFDHFA